MMSSKEILSMNLKYYRQKYNLSQEKFAEVIGTNLVYLNQMENCRRKQTLGKNIKLVRVNNELSQENIAQMLGVSQACIAKYENGNVMISTINLFNFCKEFNISLNKICGKGKIN